MLRLYKHALSPVEGYERRDPRRSYLESLSLHFQYLQYLGDGSLRPTLQVRRRQPSNRMMNDGERVVRDALNFGDRFCLVNELVRDEHGRRYAQLFQFDSVVQTALRAGASVPDRYYGEIALPCQLRNRVFRRGSGCIRLAGCLDVLQLELLTQHVPHHLQ